MFCQQGELLKTSAKRIIIFIGNVKLIKNPFVSFNSLFSINMEFRNKMHKSYVVNLKIKVVFYLTIK